jgi:translocation and assembly module TamB
MPEPPAGGGRRSTRWERVALWTLAVLMGLTAVMVIGVAMLLRSQRFHEYALTTARQSASEALGVQVEIENFAVHFSGISPTLDVYGVVIHGAAPYANPPLLELERARIGVRVISLLRKRWYLSEITLHHPVVRIRVDANGNNNLPKPKNSNQNSNGLQPLFDLAIRHAVLNDGEIYYNDRRNGLDGELREVLLTAGFERVRKAYAGQIVYSEGKLRLGGYAPIPHALSAEFEMSPTHLDVRKGQLRSGASAIAFSGTVDDFSNPRAGATYHATVDTAELRREMRMPELPLGVWVLDGQAGYAAKPQQAALNGLTANGTVRSERVEVRWPYLTAEVRAVRAMYSMANGDAEIRGFNASLLGGTANGSLTVRDVAGEQVATAHATVNGVSLAAVKQGVEANTPQNVSRGLNQNLSVGGTVQAVAEAHWKGSPVNITASADATIDGAGGSTQSGNTVPVSGVIHASYTNSDEVLTLRQSYLRTPGTMLVVDGTTGVHSQMKVALDAEDLHEVESIVEMFTATRSVGLYGRATFNGTLSGQTSAPRLMGELNGASVRVRGTDWRLLRAHLDVSPGGLEIQDGQVEAVSGAALPVSAAVSAAGSKAGNGAAGSVGNVKFNGRVGWTHGRITQSSPFALTLTAQRMDAAQLARLAGSTMAVTGTLNANVQAHGSAQNPMGQGRVELLRGSAGGETIQSAVVEFNGDGKATHASVKVAMPAGVTTGTGTYYAERRGYEAHVETDNFRLDQLQAVKGHNLSIAGAMKLVADGRGTIDDPQLTASVEIPELHAQRQTIEHLALQANVARHVANITLDTRAVNANIRGRATVQLTGEYEADAVLDTEAIPLQPLLATYAPSQAEDVTGQTELHATLKGPLKDRGRIEAHAVIPELSLHYQKSIDLAATGPIRADYANGVLTVQRSGLKGTGTDIQFQGSVPLLDRTKAVALLMQGTADLRLASLFDPDVRSAGQLRFNINSYGAASDANVEGEVQVVNASFSSSDLPLGLSNGNGTLALTRDRLNITNFEGTVGGGKVTARGGMIYRPSLQFDVSLAGQGMRLLYPDGVRQELSANLTLNGAGQQATLRGQVNVDQLSFAPDFDLSSLAAAFGGGIEEPPSRGFLSNLRLNVMVRSSQNVNMVSRILSVSGAANLRITGTAAQPVVLGRINLTDGELLFQGNRYVLAGGVIDFVNPSRTDPNVNASLTTTIQQYSIGMRFEGPLERMRTSYSSDPALPPADIINLIAFGKTQEAANATATPTNLTAEQSIASAVSGQVTSRVEKLTGISTLSVDPTLGNSQQNGGATVTVQQRVTSKIFVTFSDDVTSTQRQVIQVQYQATPKVSVSGTRDQNGGFGFDTRITREW